MILQRLDKAMAEVRQSRQYEKIFMAQCLIVAKEDGHLLWKDGRGESQNEIAALAVGAWKAAQAMVALSPDKNFQTQEALRLSFDTSESGVYVVPVDTPSSPLFLAMLFQNEINPGLLKRQLRQFSKELSSLLDTAPFPEEQIGPMAQNYLFGEISDDEIDKLFSNVGF